MTNERLNTRRVPAASPHTFHIPVMGTGFTIDTPLRVARYGISSVISLVDDELIEQMRGYYCRLCGEPYLPVARHDPDARARRITAYLNLVERLVHSQLDSIQTAPFEPGSEIVRYFELLPDGGLKREYQNMLGAVSPQERARQQAELRKQVTPGCIDVNIMTKLDRDKYIGTAQQPPEFSDAMSALRGYALSTLHSSLVLSAGLNQRLYAYLASFDDFLPDRNGDIRKKVVLKVSDYRSAEIQGRYLAKRGIWVSEFRVESGLNCGGHAFATKGQLLGPILEEFKAQRNGLRARLFEQCAAKWTERGLPVPTTLPAPRLTVQGGIGTADEDRMLREHYGADGTGWGTPFLLVPEATNVDAATLKLLAEATEQDIELSDSSPLGVPFWNLKTSISESARLGRIANKRPGSPCVKGYLRSNTEFTAEPLCTASHSYQSKKLAELNAKAPGPDYHEKAMAQVLRKACICHDLGGGAARNAGVDANATPAVCPGPAIAFFSKVATLNEMIGHIYGRSFLLEGTNRPHMFVNEMAEYIRYFNKALARLSEEGAAETAEYIEEFRANLLSSMEYYLNFMENISEPQRIAFRDRLIAMQAGLLSS